MQALRTGGTPRGWLDPAAWLRLVLDVVAELFGPTRRTPHHHQHPSRALPGADPQRERDGRAGVDKLTGPQWEVAIRYAVAHTNPRGGKPADLQPRLGFRFTAHLLVEGMDASVGTVGDALDNALMESTIGL